MTRTRAKRASYRDAVHWIAYNDEPGSRITEEVESFISTLLVADLFGKPESEVAAAVIALRESEDI